MKRHTCVTQNRARATLLMNHAKEMVAQKNSLTATDPEEWQAAIDSALSEVNNLYGEYLGMVLQLDPESDRVNALIEKYINEGNNHSHVADGMKAMAAERDKSQKEREVKELHDLFHAQQVAALQPGAWDRMDIDYE